ncbi:MAG: cation diffusion facilitator family transporter [Acidimicrobiales bacterium]
MAGHHHDHGPGATGAGSGTSRDARLLIAIGLNVGIVVLQLVAGAVAGSVGLMADAAHNLTDVLALGVSLVAVRMARRPSTAARSFGWHRGTVLAALFNAAAILAVCVLVVVESVQRLFSPEPVEGGIVVVVALIGALANGISALVVHDGSDDLNMRSALLHLLSDAGTSVGVAITGAIILVTGGYERLDPIAALVISVLIGWQGWRLARSATAILLEGTPAGVEPAEVEAAIADTDGVDAVHDLHVWSLSSELRALSGHIVVSGHPTLEEAQVVAERVKHRLSHDFAIAHATLELECEPCAPDPHCEADSISSG